MLNKRKRSTRSCNRWVIPPATSSGSPTERKFSTVESGVGVEKSPFPQNSQNLGDRKCLGKPRKSFVGDADAILFLRISREGVFPTATGDYTHPMKKDVKGKKFSPPLWEMR